ncbi:alpha/beta fold hydrolase [Candidatus Mycoplasma mahonii]|uniref:alpha/beta fold hydrolase n=1 Tax=Candidatus Mycoplasma mahonii TaxID=3004105 RepID=UPI0026F25E28|nr:alpha/beta hydrolase [Candidatus Mycoplasma mahonii]WKX02808.1 alpha/beta hydrolase [Candidatus Mycoplasma mahonii]
MKKEVFQASNDKTKITYYSWKINNPKATFQILHGSIEHAIRYDHFAKTLNKAGFSVYAMDIRGHGETGKRGILGHIADHNGANKVLHDVHQLNNIIKSETYGKKLILLGHSMGSFIARAYVTKYNDIDIIIPIGTNQKPRIVIHFLNLLAEIKSIRHAQDGGTFISNWSYKSFNNKFKDEGKFAWLSNNKLNRENYSNDALTKFEMSNKSFSVFSNWMKMFTSKIEASNMDKKVCVLLLNGVLDPVGSMGKEVAKANKFYTKLGYYSEQIEYEDMRHEILYDDLKELVYHDIIQFVNNQLSCDALIQSATVQQLKKSEKKQKE